MDSAYIDRLARSLARPGPRRGALKALAAGALVAGLLVRGPRSTAARDSDDMFQKCMDACRACDRARCPSKEDCAASCSQSLW
jgi:hypothetical protein